MRIASYIFQCTLTYLRKSGMLTFFLFLFVYGCKNDVEYDGDHSHLQVCSDYALGLKEAQKTHNPIFLTFTAHASLCCKAAYFHEWVLDEEFKAKLSKNYVVVTLYVDDKKELDTQDSYISPNTKKRVTTIGHKNADLQISLFHSNAQPFSVILDENGKVMKEPLVNKGINYINDLKNFMELN